MYINKAVEILIKRFSINKNFKPTNQDKIALNTLFTFVKDSKEKVFDADALLNKLVFFQVYHRIQGLLLEDFREDDFSYLTSLLNTPLDRFYTSFRNSMLSNYKKQLQKQKVEDIDSKMKEFEDYYTDEVIKNKLNSTLVEVINKFSKNG